MMPSEFKDMLKIREMVFAFQKSRVFLTAIELDVFTHLEHKASTSPELAQAIDTDPRATDRLLNALVTLEFIEKENQLFRNAPIASRYLVKDKPEYLSGLMHSAHLWHSWSTLTDVVRCGHKVYQEGDLNNRDPQWLRAFIGAMHDRGKWQAPMIAKTLDLKDVKRILDVGGGSGIFAMAMLKLQEQATAVVFDLPAVCPIAQEYIDANAYTNRISIKSGDYLKDDLGQAYDLILLSAIIHINSYEDNQKLVAKAAKSLNSGGQLVILDWLMEDSRTAPAGGALFALNMLTGTECGDTYTEAEIKSWMQAASLTYRSCKHTLTGTSLIVATKA